jgi:hypothetical protein
MSNDILNAIGDVELTSEAKLLVDQCAMWCVHTGRKPDTIRDATERAMLTMATNDYQRPFAALNTKQRQIVAGLG